MYACKTFSQPSARKGLPKKVIPLFRGGYKIVMVKQETSSSSPTYILRRKDGTYDSARHHEVVLNSSKDIEATETFRERYETKLPSDQFVYDRGQLLLLGNHADEELGDNFFWLGRYADDIPDEPDCIKVQYLGTRGDAKESAVFKFVYIDHKTNTSVLSNRKPRGAGYKLWTGIVHVDQVLPVKVEMTKDGRLSSKTLKEMTHLQNPWKPQTMP